MNLPNKLTIFRVVLIPFCVFFTVNQTIPYGNIIALAIFIVASLTDLFDGKIARKYNLVTTFGKFADPLADKLLVCSLLICLVQTGKLAAWVVVIIVCREFIISGFRIIAAEKQVIIAAGWWGKFKTTFQMLLIISLLLDFSFSFWPYVELALMIIAVALTIISLVDYIAKNVNVLKDQD